MSSSFLTQYLDESEDVGAEVAEGLAELGEVVHRLHRRGGAGGNGGGGGRGRQAGWRKRSSCSQVKHFTCQLYRVTILVDKNLMLILIWDVPPFCLCWAVGSYISGTSNACTV